MKAVDHSRRASSRKADNILWKHANIRTTSTMDFLDFSTQYAAAGFVLVLAVAFLLFQPTGLVKWLQKKNYQYEVTFSLYMLTPTEKFIFSTPLLLLPYSSRSLDLRLRPLPHHINVLHGLHTLPTEPHCHHVATSVLLLRRRRTAHGRITSLPSCRQYSGSGARRGESGG